MDQDDREQKPRRNDGKTFTPLFWVGFVLAFAVYWLVANNPLGFFVIYVRYNIAILLPLIVLAKFVRNESNSRFGIIYQFLQKFNTFVFEGVFEKIKLLLLGFVLGFMFWTFLLFIVPRAKIAHMQHIHQVQQIHRNSNLGDK